MRFPTPVGAVMVALWLSAAVVAPAAAQASPAAQTGIIAYPAAFFSEFSPINAFDMVGRVPGFTFNGGEATVRGLAGAAGNVLIDGERPSSKSVTLEDTLKRIRPEGVERIELIRGGAPGVDMLGQPVVANVVRKAGGEASAAIDATGRFYNARHPSHALRLEAARRSGGLRLEGAVLIQDYAGWNEAGRGIVVREDGAGAVLSGGPVVTLSAQRIRSFNGAAEYRLGRDTWRLNLGWMEQTPFIHGVADLITAAGARPRERNLTDNNIRTAEIGGDYQRRFEGGAIGRLAALYTNKHTMTDAFIVGRGPTQASGKDNTAREAIVRGSLAFAAPYGVSLEGGGEAAFNALDAASRLSIGGAPVILPSANVLVEERRAEGFATATAKPAPGLSVEAGFRVETSTITQSGDVALEKTFTFVKPRVVLAYAVTPSTQLRGRVERTVGQLDFADFAASADVNSGVTSAGNADLEPERAWLAEVAVEQRFWGAGAVVLTARRHVIEQVVDVVPVFAASGAVFSAPGNIGDGWKEELILNLTLPTDRLGLAGGQLRFNATARQSRVTDPTTHERREITKVRILEGDATYTQDFPGLKSTLVVESGAFGAKDRQFFIGEVQTVVDTAISKATWLYRPRPDLTLAFAIENFGAKERARRRLIYAGPRSAGVLAVKDYRSAELDPWLSFRLRKTY